MGNYNPHAPRIIGQEWVPIRDEDLVYSPSVNAVELGTSFALDQIRQARDARFYVNQKQATPQTRQCGLVNLYPQGREDLTGPISQVIIPVAQVQVTGAGFSFIGGATSNLQALYQPGDGLGIEIDYAVALRSVACWFDVVRYGPLLYNKRILNVSMLYTGYLQDKVALDASSIKAPFMDPDPSTPATLVDQRNDAGVAFPFSAPTAFSNAGVLAELSTSGNSINTDASINQIIATFNLGDVNNFWSTAVAPTATDEKMSWRYEDLRRLDPSYPTIDRQHIRIRAQLPLTPWQAANPGDASPMLILDYVALRVIYCEETRIATGGKVFGYNFGVNIIPLRDVPSYNTDPIVPAGTYVPTLSWVNPGTLDFGRATSGDFPKLNALRELYQIPSHVGTQINVPFPLEDRLGDTFTSVETHVLPQLTLHASGGTWLEPHVYGRQAIGQVYSSLTVTQEIQDGLAGGSASWPWVRYVARRFGDTTVPLNVAIAGQSVAITPAEFDALDALTTDGWKEVTLRFATAPTMGSGIIPQAVWSATSELAGNRWEVLGACAPAISGIPGNSLNLAPSPNQLAIATYGQPVSGSSINLGWIPQGVGSPPVSGTADDNTSDAFIIFAQDMPTVTGFVVTTLTQPITGIGQDCGVDPCCIPTDILYNQITWSLPSWLDGNGGLLLPGTSGNYASTPDNAALDIVGDIDLRVDLTADDWTPTADDSFITKWGSAGQRSYILQNIVAGNLQLNWSADGTAALTATSTVVPTPGPSGRLAVRATLDVDNGAAGRTATFYTAPTMAGPWTQLGATVVQGGTTSIFSSTAPVEVGSQSGGTGNMLAGTVHAAEARSGINGTVVANPDFAAQPTGTTMFTDSAGRTWTVNGTASIFDGTSLIPGAGAIELQRRDAIEADFQTIMSATSFVSSFNDYEARVGITSDYRIRLTDVYDFPGLWSSTVTATIASPGVSGGCLDDGHVLIFTSNERQTGSINLAYSSVWMDQQVTEDFIFPEAGFVELQLMYNKDFYTAFRPLERSGERFSRTVLVQAAAIAPETLGDFKSLRDMAWDTVNYICVRDEDGNRWLATVLVPGGRVLRDRRLYLAPVDIIEVTDTPTPVDPYVT